MSPKMVCRQLFGLLLLGEHNCPNGHDMDGWFGELITVRSSAARDEFRAHHFCRLCSVWRYSRLHRLQNDCWACLINCHLLHLFIGVVIKSYSWMVLMGRPVKKWPGVISFRSPDIGVNGREFKFQNPFNTDYTRVVNSSTVYTWVPITFLRWVLTLFIAAFQIPPTIYYI